MQTKVQTCQTDSRGQKSFLYCNDKQAKPYNKMRMSKLNKFNRRGLIADIFYCTRYKYVNKCIHAYILGYTH